jgi:Glutamine amidotransferase domain
MCGLFAGVGKLSSNRMIALGSMNEERGTDSVGLAYIDGNEIRIAKIAEHPCVGLNITLRKEVTEAAVSGLFIGHTRAATQGTVNSRNAHPFLADGIAFAHNGIIINDNEFGKYEVDSESLIHGIKAKDFSKYEGPIALLWIEGGKLHAYRCGNPLARGRHNGSTYLASDSDYLKEIGCTHVKELSEGMIYTFDSPFGIRTQKVNKNKTYGTSYIGTGRGYHNDYMGNTGYGWEDYQERWKRTGETKSILLPAGKEHDFPPPLKKSFNEREAEVKEDFRTPSDIVKAMTTRNEVDHCECCGELAELSDRGMCLGCITWLDNQGIDRDTPPDWLKVH